MWGSLICHGCVKRQRCPQPETYVSRDETYLLHLETMNLLLVLLSTQLYSPISGSEPGAHPFTEVLMDSQNSAAGLLRVLLRHYAERRSLPPQAPVYVPQATERRGVLRMVRSAAGASQGSKGPPDTISTQIRLQGSNEQALEAGSDLRN